MGLHETLSWGRAEAPWVPPRVLAGRGEEQALSKQKCVLPRRQVGPPLTVGEALIQVLSGLQAEAGVSLGPEAKVAFSSKQLSCPRSTSWGACSEVPQGDLSGI